MNKPTTPSFRVFLFLLVLLSHHLMVFGQRPPTSGPNPDETNLTPFIIGGSGLLMAAGSYLYLKSRGPKIPVTDNLRDYLWRQNIMPSPDALDLMYELNPSLSGKELMREKRKLLTPEFPEIPDEMKQLAANVPPPTYVIPENLKGLMEQFQSTLNAFQNISVTTTNPNAPKEAFNEVLGNLEGILTAPERYTEARNAVKDQLLTDLITAINQTMDDAIQTRELSEDKLILLHAIAEDLENLLFPNLNSSQPVASIGEDGDHFANWDSFLVSADKHSNENGNQQRDLKGGIRGGLSNRNDNADVKWFAFAVYKYDAEGDLITKGKEVENRYQISYASPALKDIEGSFHAINGNASYGIALLGNGKYFIKVKDGEIEVPVQNPIIHFGLAFQNPVKELHNDLTKVIIYLLE
ncbi:hypothetical protein [Cyclobacterium jeungdonense]|uniref:Uncharacterized protein n=1 Tax=Cyclobacterium jeungdonense TaxID=708087 RepID=A0ABT8C6M6_9BACT|nr:hypothetical protein [Cyclobacterium jeungdonense]MDN3687453.1 hypothetical protein [Cyclobacterium jeungdonense]